MNTPLIGYIIRYYSERSEAFRPSVARVYSQLGTRSVQKKNTSNQPTNQPTNKKIHDLRSCFPQNFETNQNF